MKRVLKKLGISLAATLALCGIGEILLVLSGFEYPPHVSPILLPLPEGRVDGRLLHERNVEQLWRPIPGATVPWGGDEVNADGMRGPLVAREKRPGVVRIAALGDSSTFGHSVSVDETYCAQLPAELAARGIEAETLNAGVVGFTVRQGIARYQDLVRDFHPDVVIAAFGSVNEHVPAIVRSDALLIEKGMFDQEPWRVEAMRLRRDLKLAHLAAFLSDELRGGRDSFLTEQNARDLWKSKNADRVGEPDWEGERRVSVDDFGRFLCELRSLVEADGARFVLLNLARKPGLLRTTPVVQLYSDKLLEVAAADGIPVVDGRALFGAALGKGATYPELFADNFHPTRQGHAILAQGLADEIARVLGR